MENYLQNLSYLKILHTIIFDAWPLDKDYPYPYVIVLTMKTKCVMK